MQSSKRDLWLIRVYYLVWLGGGGFLYPYVTLFYKQQGLSGTEMGLLSTVGWGIAMLVAPMWGRWADHVRSPRRLIQFGLIGSAVLNALLGLQTAFVWMAVIIGITSIVSSATDPLSNAQALTITNNRKSGFGSVRVWGSIGWVLITPVCGWLLEKTGLFTMFGGFAVFNLLGALVLAFIITPPPTTSSRRSFGEKADAQPTPAIGTIIRQIGLDRSMVGLAVALFIYWIVNNGPTQFESIYLEELHASTFVIGLVNTIGAMIEIGAMFWADRLVRRHGAGRILGISMLVFAAAKLIVVLSPSIPAIFAMRALNGVYYSMFVISSIAYAAEGSPSGQGSTVMALYFVTLQGLTQLIAGPMSGAIFDAIGAYWLFVIACGGGVISWLVLRLTERPSTTPITDSRT